MYVTTDKSLAKKGRPQKFYLGALETKSKIPDKVTEKESLLKDEENALV